MKSIRTLVAAMFLFAAIAALSNASAKAQTPAAATGKIAVIDSGVFTDEKQGILKVVAAMKRVDGEFQPQRQELQGMQQRYNQLVEEIKKLQGAPQAVDQSSLQQKADQADRLKKDMERKAQDAQEAYQKRMREMVGPLQEDVFKQLQAYAKQNGVSVIIDAAQTPGIIYVNDGVDITNAFVAFYNQKNPATTAANGK